MRDEQSVAFQSVDDEGNRALWIGPANDAAPPLVEIVGIVGDELHGPYAPTAGDALVYLVGGPPNRAESAWYVDLASDPAGTPALLGLIDGTTGFGDVRWAPNGSGVAFRQSIADGPADIAWVGIEDGVPAAPVQVSTGASQGVVVQFESAWSADSQWFAYLAGETEGLFVVPFADGEPGEPTTILDADEAVTSDFLFGPDSNVLYVGTEIGALEGRVRRVALDGDAPGLAETISGPLVELRRVVLAADGRSLLYIGSTDEGEPAHAWVVDLSGDVAGAPVQIDQSLVNEEEVTFGALSPTSTHALYSVYVGGPGLYRRVVVDLANGAEYVLSEGDPVGWVTMRERPSR